MEWSRIGSFCSTGLTFVEMKRVIIRQKDVVAVVGIHDIQADHLSNRPVLQSIIRGSETKIPEAKT